jgi:hypothetical protein
MLESKRPLNAPNSVATGRRLEPGALLAFYIALAAIALLPIFMVDVPPLGDLPNHLARVHILNDLASSADLQKYYTTQWRLFSFQSTDFILPPLAKLLGLSLAARCYVAASFLLLVCGTAAIHRTLFGHVGIWPAAAVLFLYNFPLVQGQVSYLFATALALLLFSAWIATASYRRALRIAAFTVGAWVLFLCHFFAFAAYALMVMTFEAAQLRNVANMHGKISRLVEAGLPFVLPTGCFLFAFGGSVQGATSYGDILSKPLAVLAATTTYGRWPDIALTVLIGCSLWLIERCGLIRFAARMRFTAIVLIAVAIAMPKVVSGVYGADLRIPCLLAFILIAASDVKWRSRRQAAALAAGIAVLLVLRVAAISHDWRKFDADYREFRAADVQLEHGSRVMMIPAAAGPGNRPEPRFPYAFVAAFAVIDRDVFLPYLFTASTPLRLAPDGAKILSDQLAWSREIRWRPTTPAFAGADPETIRQAEEVARRVADGDINTSTIDWSDWPERFDYAVDLNLGRYVNPAPSLLTEIARGSYFSIYRIHPPHGP